LYIHSVVTLNTVAARVASVEFEWDEPKRLSNIAKHDVDFRNAIVFFENPHVAEKSRFAGNEQRWLAMGTIDNRYATTIFTRRGEDMRIISMRRSRNGEKRRYQALYLG
jgi:uncharacterized DUF497 family protein